MSAQRLLTSLPPSIHFYQKLPVPIPASLNVAEVVPGKVQELLVAMSAVTWRKQSVGRVKDEVVEEGPVRDGHPGPRWADSANMTFLSL